MTHLAKFFEEKELKITCDFPVPVAPRTTMSGSFGTFLAMAEYFKIVFGCRNIRSSDLLELHELHELRPRFFKAVVERPQNSVGHEDGTDPENRL